MTNRLKLALLSVLASFALLIAAGNTASAAQCKGLSKSACQAAHECSFVKAHTRSDGAKVSAFCRNKPGQGISKSSQNKSTNKAKAEKKKATKSASKDAKKSTKQTAKKSDGDDDKSAKKSTSKKKKTAKKTTKKSDGKKSTKKKSTTKKAKKTKKKSGSS